MAQKIIAFAVVQALIVQMVYSQVLGRYGGGCGCGACGSCNSFYPEQLLNSAFIQGGLSPALLSSPPCAPLVYDQPTTVIQDSSVANNLANALQLLIVSNLLSTTLPLEQNVNLPVAVSGGLAPLELLSAPVSVAPSLGAPFGCGCGGCGCNNCGFGPYNLIY